ncbi:unnamed protein product [Ixodes persulcatus]
MTRTRKSPLKKKQKNQNNQTVYNRNRFVERPAEKKTHKKKKDFLALRRTKDTTLEHFLFPLKTDNKTRRQQSLCDDAVEAKGRNKRHSSANTFLYRWRATSMVILAYKGVSAPAPAG